MSACIAQGASNFFVAAHHVTQVFLALREWAQSRGDHGLGWAATEVVLGAESAQETLRALRWEPRLDQDGNIVDIRFRGEKQGCEQDFFQAIARFVRPGSVIAMYGEYGQHLRWAFNGLDCVEQEGRVVFDPIPGYTEGDVIDISATEVRPTPLLGT